MEERLKKSTSFINNSMETNFRLLENKINEPGTQYRAEIWLPKAELAKKLTSDYYNYIDSLKRELPIAAKKSITLSKRHAQYIKEIGRIDTVLATGLAYNSYRITDPSEIMDRYLTTFPKGISNESINAFLTNLQNQVKTIEYVSVSICNEQVSNVIFRFDTYTGIIAQSSKIVEPGKEINVTAGIGAFIKAIKPAIIINGENMSLNDSGFCRYTFRAARNPGAYTMPVKISFTDENGKKQEIYSTIQYTVAKICD